jgi:hypothetical protein
LNCVEDLDGVDIRLFAPAIGIASGQRKACCPFGVAAGRDALGPELARRVRREMDHETVRSSARGQGGLIPNCGNLDSSSLTSAVERCAHISLDHRTFFAIGVAPEFTQDESGSASFGIRKSICQ